MQRVWGSFYKNTLYKFTVIKLLLLNSHSTEGEQFNLLWKKINAFWSKKTIEFNNKRLQVVT